jgi:ATP-dependent DNA helicase RecQ
MKAVTCPKCGSSMILRTARKGRNPGGQFYGCSRYPKCKGLLPLDESESTANAGSLGHEGRESPDNSMEFVFPRNLVARSRFRDYQTRFMENVAVPSKWLEAIAAESATPEVLRAFAQWRMDFPITPTKYTLSDDQGRILSILEKILTRGRITLVSHRMEEVLGVLFAEAIATEPDLSTLDVSLWQVGPSNHEHPWLDSKEESTFYQTILPTLLGQNCHQYVLPQVEIASLLPPAEATVGASYQRVDFAIFLPWQNEYMVIEIDGAQHLSHKEADEARDTLLRHAGYHVIRLPADEVRSSKGPALSLLKERLALMEDDRPSAPGAGDASALLRASRAAHQIQVVLLQALQLGVLDPEKLTSWRVVSDLDEIELLDKRSAQSLLQHSVEDFAELYTRLCRLYAIGSVSGQPSTSLQCDQCQDPSKDSITICLSGRSGSDALTFHVRDIYVPFPIAASSFSVSPFEKHAVHPSEEDLTYFLKYLFRKDTLWEGQFDGISRTLQGKDSLVLLPTGAGKSIIYQLASLLIPGRTIVIDPIISLIDDQIDNLALVGIDRCIGITSQIAASEDKSRAMQLFGQGEYLFAYIAPERFQTTEFRESLRALTVHTPIAAIVVDEAHCVSEWGHDFRTAYLNLGRTSRKYSESDGQTPPLIALTGTASRAVLKDVQRELRIEDFDAIITPRSFDRPELRFHILEAHSSEKTSRLEGFLGQKLPNLFRVTQSTLYQPNGKDTYSGIVFCPWVNGEYGVVQVSSNIKSEIGLSTAHYSGGAPQGWDRRAYRSYKRESELEFKRNRVPLLVSTKAFGMGIDKANIRYTIHLGIPPSIESFYQEAGRAGRDRRTSHCCIIVSDDSPGRSSKLLNPNTTVEEVDEIIKNTRREDNDDITRNLYFHTNSFRGIAQERKDIEEVLAKLGTASKPRDVVLKMPKKDRNVIEKALHRLLLIGVISDYTINYSSEEFGVKVTGATKEEMIETYGVYVASYLSSRRDTEVQKCARFLAQDLSGFVAGLVDLILHFIYDVIERGRRRALHEVFLACTTSSKDKDIRQRILRYLEATEYSERLDELISERDVGIGKCMDIFASVRSPNEAAEIRGQVSRYLESYPDHPGLLVLRFLSEVISRDASEDVAKQNFKAAITSAFKNYSLDQSSIIGFASWAICCIPSRHYQLAGELVEELLATFPSPDSARELLRLLPHRLSERPAFFLLKNLEQMSRSLILQGGG